MNLLPAFEVETDFVEVAREGRMVRRRSTPKRSRGGTADDVAGLMKRDGVFHLNKIEIKRKVTKSKVEVNLESKVLIRV